jgi:hypothetical protein
MAQKELELQLQDLLLFIWDLSLLWLFSFRVWSGVVSVEFEKVLLADGCRRDIVRRFCSHWSRAEASCVSGPCSARCWNLYVHVHVILRKSNMFDGDFSSDFNVHVANGNMEAMEGPTMMKGWGWGCDDIYLISKNQTMSLDLLLRCMSGLWD